MQIKVRLSLQFLAIVSSILIISFISINLSTRNYRHNEFYELLDFKANTIADLYFRARHIDTGFITMLDMTIRDRINKENFMIFNSRDQVIFKNRDSIEFMVPHTVLNRIRREKYLELEKNGFEVLGMTYENNNSDYVLIIGGIDLYGKNKVVNRRKTLIILFFIIILIVAIAGWFFSHRALLPITRVIEKVEEISPYELNSRIDKSRNEDEIGRLINTFNNLLERIEEAFKLQKLFVAGASHQLKNPLTVITSQLEVSLINERSNEEYRRTIASVLEDIKDLNKLTYQLMELARISYSKDISFEIIRVDDILWSVQEYVKNKYPYYHYHFTIISLPENENELCIYGNETLLRNAMINLAENACKYSNDNSVYVSLEFSGNEIRVMFKDNGPGIEEKDKALIFEPFFRGQARANIKGHGIGLALVHQIIKLHKADIHLNTAPGKGSEFILTFRLNSNEDLIEF